MYTRVQCILTYIRPANPDDSLCWMIDGCRQGLLGLEQQYGVSGRYMKREKLLRGEKKQQNTGVTLEKPTPSTTIYLLLYKDLGNYEDMEGERRDM